MNKLWLFKLRSVETGEYYWVLVAADTPEAASALVEDGTCLTAAVYPQERIAEVIANCFDRVLVFNTDGVGSVA